MADEDVLKSIFIFLVLVPYARIGQDEARGLSAATDVEVAQLDFCHDKLKRGAEAVERDR